MSAFKRAVRLAIVLITCACLAGPTIAMAASSSGELSTWSPHADAPKTGTTKISVGCTDDVKRTFYASNTKTVFVNTSGAAKVVSRNTLFRAIHRWVASDDCPDIHVHWKWKERADGTRYRYVTRFEAANRPD